MIHATAIISIGIFLAVFWMLGVARIGVGVLVTAKDAITAFHDKNLNDEARETKMRRASIQLMLAFLSITLRSLGALVAAYVPIWMAGLMGWADSEQVVRYLSRWDVIAGASLVIISGYVIWARLRPSE